MSRYLYPTTITVVPCSSREYYRNLRNCPPLFSPVFSAMRRHSKPVSDVISARTAGFPTVKYALFVLIRGEFEIRRILDKGKLGSLEGTFTGSTKHFPNAFLAMVISE